MNTIFLTSNLFLYERDENNIKHTIPLQNVNYIVDRLKENIKKYDNFLYVASSESLYKVTDSYAKGTFESFDSVLPFKNYQILDKRTKKDKEDLIKNADLILLAGGHVPTQNKFLKKLDFKNLVTKSNAVIVGISAGSMNCSTTVFAPPELEGESTDENYKNFFPGLGLTDLILLPHYNDLNDSLLDGQDFMKTFVIPYSKNKKIYALTDGSYIMIKDGKNQLVGESFLIENEKVTPIKTPCEIE